MVYAQVCHFLSAMHVYMDYRRRFAGRNLMRIAD